MLKSLHAEARRAERSPHPDAMDLYFQGMACANKGRTSEYLAQARSFFERALALDPSNIDALVGMADGRRDKCCRPEYRRPGRASRGGRSDVDQGALHGAEPRSAHH